MTRIIWRTSAIQPSGLFLLRGKKLWTKLDDQRIQPTGEMNPDDSSPLFDSHGNPVRKPQSDREALEALIRSELAEAKERLHELNKEGLKDIADRYYKPKISFWHKSNAYTFAALVAVLLFGWFAIPEIIRTKTISYFRDNLVGPALTNTVNNIVNDDASALIEARLNPLKKNINNLEEKIIGLNVDISNKQAQLASDQMAIREQLHPLAGQIASLQSTINVVKEQAKKLEARTQDRQIDAKTRQAMLEALANVPKGKVIVAALQSDREAVAFGKEITGLLNEAGCKATFTPTVTMNATYTGLVFIVKDPANRPKYADIVLSVFKASSIAADGWLFIKDYENDSLGIYVFPKPAPLDE